MTSLLKIGLILMAVTVLLVLINPAEADDEVKRKRVIIKIPHRVKHIYHHHTKKVHVHKKKPKPAPKKKPHKHVHVVAEEEEIVQPIKSWKSIHSPFKGGNTGWDDWKGAPSGFKHSVKHPGDFGYSGESSHMEEDFSFEDDHDSRESRTYERPHSHKSIGSSISSGGGGGKRGKKKGGRSSSSSYRSHEEPSFEASYEVHHHRDQDQDFEGERPRRKPKSKMSSGMSVTPRPHGRESHTSRSTYGRTTRRPRLEDKYRELNEYDELYDRGPAYPERKEHPSWHDRSRSPSDQENLTGVGSEQSIWNLPRFPEVNEYIDDVNDTPDPGVTFGNSGGFYPSSYSPITTITSSVVENSPAVPSGVNSFPANEFHGFPADGAFHDFPANNGFNNGYNNGFRSPNGYDPGAVRSPVPEQRPVAHPVVPTDQPAQYHPVGNYKVNNNRVNQKHKKNPGYLSQVSQTQEGLTLSYQSHIGHSSDVGSPSSSFQSVSFGGVKSKK